jgi:UDP-3-O-[3-hydroxymyristoyl] glucosamine N-acyltransferase
VTVGPAAEIGTDARIGECAVIGRDAVVGARVHLPAAALVADGAAVEASAD